MQLMVWKTQCRQSLITDPGPAVIANSLILSAFVSGYFKAADGDASLRGSTEGSLSISGFWFSWAPLIECTCYWDEKRERLQWCTALRNSFDGASCVVREVVIESSLRRKFVLGKCFWHLTIRECLLKLFIQCALINLTVYNFFFLMYS